MGFVNQEVTIIIIIYIVISFIDSENAHQGRVKRKYNSFLWRRNF